MNVVLQNLLKLQTIEFGEVPGKSAEAEAAELRGLIPQPFLGHYDRLRARGKKGLAIVRNDVCTGCHMKQTRGKIATIIRGDIQLCDSCDRYLVVLEEAESQPPPVVEAPKRTAKPRKRKALVPA